MSVIQKECHCLLKCYITKTNIFLQQSSCPTLLTVDDNEI